MIATPPIGKRIVLVGAGHAHVEVLRAFGMQPEPGVGLTLVAKEVEAAYSGMLPGWAAGHYTFDRCHIDADRLAQFAGARLIHGEAVGIDRANRRLLLRDRPPLLYDVLSLDIGITPDLSGIDGAAEHAITVKPVSSFTRRWRELLVRADEPDGPRRFVMIGAGAAGFELVLALHHRLVGARAVTATNTGSFDFTLIGSGSLLATLNGRARATARQALQRVGVTLIEHDAVVAVTASDVVLASGRRIPADAALLTTKAAAPGWLTEAGLSPDASGFVAVRPTLQVPFDDEIFAAGDCADVIGHSREKAGVFAVRQGPWLTDNLRRRARGEPALPHEPQKQYLTLLSLGAKSAIAARGPFSVAGDGVWHWKDRIDQAFMDRYADLPMWGASDPASDAEMRCGGCAAKIGPHVLQRALDRLDGAPTSPRDDAAVIDDGGPTLRLETIDFFRAFWPEPYVFGHIAAEHALSDVYAMGGQPERALAIAVLPHAGPRQSEDDLFQLMAGARATFARAGVTLVGGHTSEGAELGAGFFVSGSVARDRLLAKGGLQTGDVLVLTKPLGTGILFAGWMRRLTCARDIAAALAGMRQSNRDAARILASNSARAMTDVTGFGLAGHLLEMLKASGRAARIELTQVRRYSGVDALLADGIRSTLLSQNLALAGDIGGRMVSDEALGLLLDPQTSGGLLAGLPAECAATAMAALAAAGVEASIVGAVVDAAGASRPLIEVD
jgi:selenide, water dikinase